MTAVDLPDLQGLPGRLDRLARLVAAAHAALPADEAPCFAHLRVRSVRGVRDLLLGARSHLGGGVTILDWQTAPLAQVFFGCLEGDEYELELDGRVLLGEVLERSLLRMEAGQLVEVRTADEAWTRGADGAWTQGRRHEALRIGAGDGVAARHRGGSLSIIDAPLDEAQRRAVELPPGLPTLVLGEAGCGKTTVAVHRVAHLCRRARQEGRSLRAAVIVPTEGLRRLTRTLLDRLELESVEVWSFGRWAGRQARRSFLDLPERESRDARAGTIGLKRHPSLRVAIAECAARTPERGGRVPLHARRSDLLHLFGDRPLLERAAAASEGAITPSAIDDTIAHTRVQFSRTTEQDFAHADAERLATIDGANIDDGTPMQDAGTVDSEDYAVMFELDRMRAALRGVPPHEPTAYDCLVLDEAQELAPLELALAGRSVAEDGTLIVAGDAGQQVDATAFFVDWPAAMAELGSDEHGLTVLETSYRCPPDVTALARRVLQRGDTGAPDGGAAAQSAPSAPSANVSLLRYPNECHLVTALGDALRDLRGREPGATVAVIARTTEAARRLARLLERATEVHLALAGDFLFDAGINVTSVEEVKGLEFDFVVVPDASAAAWPDNAAARRALYVAITRTVRQLILTTVGTPSALLAPL